MGLKRRSRFAYAAACSAPTRPTSTCSRRWCFRSTASPSTAGRSTPCSPGRCLPPAIVAILWLVDRLKPRGPDTLPFRPGPLFIVAFLAVLTHPFLDWLTTYAIALFAPVSWHWYSGDAIFIIDWVYWLLMATGIGCPPGAGGGTCRSPGRPAQIAGIVMLAYIGLNLAESAWVEQATAAELRRRGHRAHADRRRPAAARLLEATIEWRSADRFGSGSYDPASGIKLDPAVMPTRPRRPAACACRSELGAMSALSSSGRECRSSSASTAAPISPTSASIIRRRRSADDAPDGAASAFLIPLDNRRSEFITHRAMSTRGEHLVRADRRFSTGGGLLARLTAPAIERVLDQIDRRLACGGIETTLPDGDQAPPRLPRAGARGRRSASSSWMALVRLATSGSVGWYKAWTLGEWSSPDPVPLFELFSANACSLGDVGRAKGPFRWVNALAHRLRDNAPGKARRTSPPITTSATISIRLGSIRR